MAKLYVDCEDGSSHFEDEEGIDFPNAEIGRTELLRTLAEVFKDALYDSDQQVFAASIRDVSGNIIYSAKVTVSGTWHETRSA